MDGRTERETSWQIEAAQKRWWRRWWWRLTDMLTRRKCRQVRQGGRLGREEEGKAPLTDWLTVRGCLLLTEPLQTNEYAYCMHVWDCAEQGENKGSVCALCSCCCCCKMHLDASCQDMQRGSVAAWQAGRQTGSNMSCQAGACRWRWFCFVAADRSSKLVGTKHKCKWMRRALHKGCQPTLSLHPLHPLPPSYPFRHSSGLINTGMIGLFVCNAHIRTGST